MHGNTDPYIIVEDGCVTNAPSLPVFDMDALNETCDEYTYADVEQLRARLSDCLSTMRHDLRNPPSDAQDHKLRELIDNCERWLAQRPELAAQS